MFNQTVKADVNGFLSEQKRKREERQNEKAQIHAALVIQSYWRGYIARKKLVAELRSDISSSLSSPQNFKAIDFIQLLKKLKFNFDDKKDHDLFVSVCKFLFESLVESENPIGYESCILRKDTAAYWIALTKWLLLKSLNAIKSLSTTIVSDTKTLNVILSLLLILTDSTKWKRVVNDQKLAPGMRKVATSFVNFLFSHDLHPVLRTILFDGLAKASCSFTKLSLTALFTLSVRPLLTRDFDEDSVASYATEILTVPGFVLHMNSLLPQTYEQVIEQRICSKVILLLFVDQPKLEGSSVLYLVANLIQLSLLEIEVLADHCLEYCVVLSKLLNQLMSYVGGKKSNQSSWHPILGWFAQPIDKNISAALPHVTTQLKLLWHSRMVRLLFSDLYEQALLGKASSAKEQPVQIQTLSPAIARQPSFTRQNKTIASFKKKFGLGIFLNQVNSIGRKCGVLSPSSSLEPKLLNSVKGPSPKDLPEALKAVCLLYCSTFSCLREIRNDILAGLSLGDLLPRIWRLIYKCGSYKDWAQVVIKSEFSTRKNCPLPCPEAPNEVHLLFLFLAASSNLLVILDDIELFELEKSFSREELCEMGQFFNLLFYESVLLIPDPTQLAMWTPGVDKIQMTVLPLCHRMLEILYERDNRFNYAPPGMWLIRDVRASAFLADVRKSKPHAQFLLKCAPHIIPHRERIALFRDFVRADKLSLGRRLVNYFFVDESPVGATINVHRNRIVEDGYQQLANLSPHQLKLKIRVIFCNPMGLDEVGIDLDGVFKEFLEETIRRVFDPSLNLFKTTSDHRLYPSPTSYLQDNHLQLFEFLGKMLAKAIYEGILVDVPFATFFLTQLLGREKTGCYSFLDELATLDRELYKGLTQIKHYEGDVSDLALTFSYNEDKLGVIDVHDLCPGGRYIPVTNDLKISYVHKVAHFRMYKQIRAQSASFIRGFYSILNPAWLNMFSADELQKLVSGDSANIDIEDLKKYTKYTGGFHAKHRVIVWLWDILKRDFDEKDRSLFLKFVTSCSKPPLLGFCYLDPQFCIRCVQYSHEDQDPGDSFGSVMKAFFNLNSQPREEAAARLPTASTCFNLLKLPNYASRTLLKEKLLYAIHSNAGFELS